MSVSSSVVSFGPNSTVSMIQSMVRSWQTENQDQVDQDIANLKSTASTLDPGYIGIMQASRGKLNAAIIKAGLEKGGSDKSYDEWDREQVEDTEQEFVRENSLSSADISDALYSGGSINNEDLNSVGFHVGMSFSSLISDMLTEDQPNTALAGQLSQAIATHTLTVQKATDVQGLKYHINIAVSASGGGSSYGVDEGWNTSVTGVTVDPETHNYISNVASDGKHHLVIDPTGDLGLYLTW